eukprot:c19394_g1_i1.p2 GENE.c19394_g1_i1~~c19394_g1_i1.p2  ORF type:complete len:129 (-),score=13.29 c19394_g1_i1:334-720(-)
MAEAAPFITLRSSVSVVFHLPAKSSSVVLLALRFSGKMVCFHVALTQLRTNLPVIEQYLTVRPRLRASVERIIVSFFEAISVASSVASIRLRDNDHHEELLHLRQCWATLLLDRCGILVTLPRSRELS